LYYENFKLKEKYNEIIPKEVFVLIN
jgi:hypothetical protein